MGGMATEALLTDFVSAVSDLSPEEVLRACPAPLLLWGLASPATGSLLERMRQALADAPRVRVLVLGEPTALPPGGPAAARLHIRRGAWTLEALGEGVRLQGQPLRAGAEETLANGQHLQVGSGGGLFLLPQELPRLVALSQEALTRIVLPPTGALLSDLRQLVRSPHAPGPSSPPFLIETPTDAGELEVTPSTPGTLVLDDEVLLGLERDRTAPVWAHSLVSRQGAAVVSVGRHEECDVVLRPPSVSKRHAEFHPGPQGWRVMDLESQNGTWVRGQRIPANVLTPVASGEQLSFGTYRCVLLFPDEMRSLLSFLSRRLGSE